MKSTQYGLSLGLKIAGVVLCASVGASICVAQTQANSAYSITPDVQNKKKFSQAELTKLASPIALYPDILLANILPASTFPDQIADASLLIRTADDAGLIEEQRWDPSVKAVAGYPGVLKMMYQKLDWTTDLGKAFLFQREALMGTFQTLRAKAKAQGNLSTSENQKVTSETTAAGTTVIKIEPANPQTVYVPQAATTTVYTQPVSNYQSTLVPLVTFGLGMAVGSAMSNDHDHNDVYVYGGSPWGHSHSIWVNNNSAANDWVDYRQERWDDVNNLAKDRQDFKQESALDRRDRRQDWASNNPDKITKQNAEKARSSWQSNSTQRQANVSQRRASRPQSSSTAFSGRSGAAGRSYSARGSVSRSGGGGRRR